MHLVKERNIFFLRLQHKFHSVIVCTGFTSLPPITALYILYRIRYKEEEKVLAFFFLEEAQIPPSPKNNMARGREIFTEVKHMGRK